MVVRKSSRYNSGQYPYNTQKKKSYKGSLGNRKTNYNIGMPTKRSFNPLGINVSSLCCQ